jgi:hypothetical protein
MVSLRLGFFDPRMVFSDGNETPVAFARQAVEGR